MQKKTSPGLRMEWAAVTAKSCDLRANDKLVLIMLTSHARHDTGLAWPSREALAEETGLSLGSVKNSLSRLKQQGLIVDTGRRHPTGTRQIVIYEVVGARLQWVTEVSTGQRPSNARKMPGYGQVGFIPVEYTDPVAAPSGSPSPFANPSNSSEKEQFLILDILRELGTSWGRSRVIFKNYLGIDAPNSVVQLNKVDAAKIIDYLKAEKAEFKRQAEVPRGNLRPGEFEKWLEERNGRYFHSAPKYPKDYRRR